MPLFSQRKGFEPLKKLTQENDIDEDLRNGLWSELSTYVFSQYKRPDVYPRGQYVRGSNLEPLLRTYWIQFYKVPVDTLPRIFDEAYSFIRSRYFDCRWDKVYDFVEFTSKHYPFRNTDLFRIGINGVLEREQSAYRLIGDQITSIISEIEIDEIDEALKKTKKFSGVNTHLKTAIELLSNRKNPDYRNSIKESISAVEALCREITGDPKATLGQALKVIEQQRNLHGALKQGFSSLYGYTSDADGIRHAMMKEPDIQFSDAKYMLVSCTAFINFLIDKTK